MSVSDATLIRRWNSDGDADSFQVLVERHSTMVYHTCLRVLRSPEDAEEVTQDCFLRLAQRPPNRVGPLGAWLHRVALNRSLDVLRSRKRRRSWEVKAAVEPGVVADESAWNDLKHHLDYAVAQLPEDLREVIVARFLEGQTQAEIGQGLGITRQAVAQRIERGIANIRRYLDRRGVLMSTTGLGCALSELTAGAASLPSSLHLALGNIALAGPAHLSATFGATPVITGGIVMKKTIVAGVATLALGLLVLLFALTRSSTQEPLQRSNLASRVNEHKGVPVDLAAEQEVTVAGVVDASTPLAEAAVASENAAEDESRQPAFVSGHIRDAAGNAVQGLDVQIFVMDTNLREQNVVQTIDDLFSSQGRIHSTVTDVRGYYEFSGLDRYGIGIVNVDMRGFVAMDDAPGIGRLLDIVPGARITGVDFALRQSMPIIGRVLSPEHRPVANAKILGMQEFSVATTDAAGVFEMEVIDSGRPLDFAIRADGFPTATVWNLSPGVDGYFVIVLRGFASLTGTITESDATPSVGRRVVAEPIDYEGPIVSAITADDGTYAMENLAAATYRVTVQSHDGFKLSRAEDLSSLRDGETRVWDHRIAAPAIVEGRVTSASNGQPIAEACVAWVRDGFAIAETRADARGRYRLELYGADGTIVLQPLHAPAGGGPVDIAALERFAASVRVQSNVTSQVDLQLPDASIFYVRFVDPDGHAITDGIVKRHTWNAADASLRTGYSIDEVMSSDAQGWYAIPCPSGSGCKAVFKAAPEHLWLQAESSQFVPVGIGDSFEEDVPVYYRSNLQGKIFGPDGQGLYFTRLILRFVDEHGEESFASPETDKDGDFVVETRAAYGVTVELTGPEAEHWTWSLEKPIDLPPGDHVELGAIHLRAVG